MAKLFVAKVQREVARLAKASGEVERKSDLGSQSLEAELATLPENLLAGIVGATIMAMIPTRGWNAPPCPPASPLKPTKQE